LKANFVMPASSLGKSAANIIRVASGNFLEMYDFMVFAYYAPNISRAFFPIHSPFISLMLTFMTFGAGFLMRPLGAVVLGAYTDHRGRRAGLLLTLTLMALGTLSLACTPDYAAIGLWAPLLVVSGRLIQGFSAGAELGTVSVYLSEIAPAGKKGFYVSWQSASQQCAVILAAVMGLWLNAYFGPESMNAWGWRIPLLAGCLIVPFLYWLRRSLPETQAFTVKPQARSATALLYQTAKAWPIIIAGALMVVMTTVSFYLITAYTPTFGKVELKLSSESSFLVTLLVGAANFVWLIVMGALSDRIGRRHILLASTIGALLTAYPAMSWLVSAPSFERLLIVELWFSFLYGSYNGAMVVYLTEVVPPSISASAFSVAYSLATAIFGGFTPAISTYLIQATGDQASPGIWLSVAAILGLAGIFSVGRLSMHGMGREHFIESAAQ
jgi:MFS family permease